MLKSPFGAFFWFIALAARPVTATRIAGRFYIGRYTMRYLPLFSIVLFMLAACTTPGRSQAPDSGTRVTQAVASPFSDLNLVREKIPPVLIEAQKTPYLPPANLTCAVLADEVRKLDEALGPDLDVLLSPLKPNLLERGANAVEDAVFDALKGAAEGVMPFRRWVRKLSGAERYSREVAAAIAAGIVRRSFLKGIGQNLGCLPPAAPILQEESPEEPQDFLSLQAIQPGWPRPANTVTS
ncbi:hypothetical protein [Thiobacillus sp.]